MNVDPDPVVRRSISGVDVDLILGDDGFRVAVDVDVRTPTGQVFNGTFFSLGMIAERLAHYRLSGECAGGTYFWCSNAIFVPELNEEVILASVFGSLRNRNA
jgi:hypothetical protein